MSAPAHTVRSVQQFLIKNGMILVPYPPYSPNLAPSNFFSFPQMKNIPKGKHFVNVEEVKQKTAEALKGIKVNEFDQWNKVSIGVVHQMEGMLKVTEV